MARQKAADYRPPEIRADPVVQKSKIELLRKSREVWFLDAFTPAKLCSAATKVRGRFCTKRCGPSHRRVRNASAVLKNFVRQPKKTFSTLSALNRHRDLAERPLCAEAAVGARE